VSEAARSRGLAGWVRNRPDGTVEVAVEGPATTVDELLDEIRRGPPGASVEFVEEITVDYCDPPITTHFRIVR